MKRASLLVMTALLVGMLAVSVSQAQTDQTTGSTSSSTMGTATSMLGTVVSSSSTSLVVRTDSGDQMTFVVDGASTVPSTLNPGDRVSVSYHPMDNGQYHVATVTMSSGAGTTSNYGTSGTTNNYGTSGTSSTNNYGTSETTADERLPRTAGRMPLVALIGALSIGAAIGMRLINRSRARA